MNTAETRLAVYGTLAPGQVNHHEVADLKGEWLQGTVNGNRFEVGWGAALGFPGLILDPSGPLVTVYLLESFDLPANWTRLDEFEGPSYRRVVTTVRLATGERNAYIYELAT
jgi:gamma-glutamylcyclotransferase (GGCT)/AIG2-like uncharacterized protein YtfP